MGEAAKKMCMRASQEDQPCPEKSTTLLKPYSFEAPTKLFRSATSSFQVWQKPSGNDAEENNNNNNNPQLDLGFKLDISSNTLFAPVANNHNNTVENPPIDQAEKTIINGSFATLGAGVNVNTGLISEGQEGQPSCLDLINLAIEDDEESKRMQKTMANRGYSRKHRMKQTIRITNLENVTRNLRSRINDIHLEIERNKNMQKPLMLEQHQLKLQIAALEKDRIIKEAEIEKNMAEVRRLKELQFSQLQAYTASGVHPKLK